MKKELTPANLISVSRPILAFYGLHEFENNPIVLATWMTGVMSLDTVDGYVARKTVKSRLGAYFDISADRAVELITLFTYASRDMISYAAPTIFIIRGLITDSLRVLNSIYPNSEYNQPLSLGGADNKYTRALYGITKTVSFATLPISKTIGTVSTMVALGLNLFRGFPVIFSNRSRELIRNFYRSLTSRLYSL